MLSEEQAINALTVLTRLAQREPSKRGLLHAALGTDLVNLAPLALRVGIETGEPMPSVLSAALDENAEGPEAAVRLAETMPLHTVSFLQLATRVAAARVEIAQPGSVDQATAYVDYAQRLADVGHDEEATAAASKAVVLLREVDEDGSTELPRALWTLARCHTLSGHHTAAVAAAHDAVALVRGRTDPIGQAMLAYGLANLAQALSRADEDDEALDVGAEAVAEFRTLVESTPRGLDYQLEDARESEKTIRINLTPGPSGSPAPPDAVDIAFGALTPSQALHGLAITSTEHARRLFLSGRAGAEANTAADRAVELLRDLAADQPDAYTVQLASALTWKAAAIAETAPDQALPAAREAVAHLRVAAEDIALHPYLLEALMPLTWTLMRLQRWEEALAAMQELKALWPRDEAEGLRALASQFDTLSAELAASRKPEQSVAAGLAAVELARRLAQIEELGSATLAGALHNLSRRQAAASDDRAAAEASTEAVRLIAGPLLHGAVDASDAGRMLRQYLTTHRAIGKKLDTALPWTSLIASLCEALDMVPGTAGPLAGMAFEVIEAYRAEGKVDQALAVLEILLRRCTARPQERAFRLGYAFPAFNVVQSLLQDNRHAEAETIVEHLVTLAADRDPEVVRSTGKAACILLMSYAERHDKAGASRVATLADSALRSPAYLAARREELMEQSHDSFLHTLDQLTAARRPSVAKHRRPWPWRSGR